MLNISQGARNILNRILLGVLLIFIIIIAVIGSKSYRTPANMVHDITKINNGWNISDESDELYRIRMDRTLSKDSAAIGFFNNDACAEVYCDGELLYTCGDPDRLGKGIVVGDFFSVVPLDYSKGDNVDVSIVLFSDGHITVPDIYSGNIESLKTYPFIHYIATLVLSVIGCSAIVLLFVFVLSSRPHASIKQSYFYLIFFIFFVNTWGLMNTQYLQLLGCDPGLVRLLSIELFMFIPTPMLLYLRNTCHYLNFWDSILTIMDIIVTCVLNFCLFSGILSTTATITLSHICMNVFMAFVAFQIVLEFIKMKSLFSKALFWGFVTLFVSSLIQISSPYRSATDNNPIVLQAGISIFICTQIIVLLRNLLQLAEEGYRAETYLTLAKTDPLTGISNRTAMDLTLDELPEKYPGRIRLGCIICDLNNMKYTNDTYGHTAGDELLRATADCLHAAFDGRGVPYRTGGDEFYTMFYSTDVDMPTMLDKFNHEIDLYNESHDNKLSCAIGSAIGYVDSSDRHAISRIIQSADTQMYMTKRKMKESNSEENVRIEQ